MACDLSTPTGLAEAEQLRIAHAMAGLVEASIEIAGGVACFLHPGSWMNNAHGLGHRAPLDAAALEKLVAFHHGHGVDAALELPHTIALPALPLLADAGFVMSDIDDVYRLDLPADLPPADPAISVRELSADEVHSPAGDDWLYLSHRGSSDDEGGTPNEREADQCRRVMHHPDSRLFLATIDGQPVGTAALETSAPVAALFAGSTLPSARRRGVQRALLHARIAAANVSASAVATIGTEPNGPTARNAERLGFSLGFVRFEFRRRIAK